MAQQTFKAGKFLRPPDVLKGICLLPMHANARGCKFIGRNLKQTVLWSKITWSAMGKTTPTSSKGLLLFDCQALTRDLILSRVFFCSKVFSRVIFPILFRVANHQIADKKN